MSVAIVATTAVVAGTAVSAYGQYKAGKAAKADAERQAAIARKNAKLEAAGLAADARELARDQSGLIVDSLMNIEARGGDYTQATDLTAWAGEAESMFLDLLNAKTDVDIVLAQGESRGAALKAQGKAAEKAAMWGAAGSAISGLGSAYGVYKAGTTVQGSVG